MARRDVVELRNCAKSRCLSVVVTQQSTEKERAHCKLEVCPGVMAKGETVSIYVAHNHLLLQLKRALPWEALWSSWAFSSVMRRFKVIEKKLTCGPLVERKQKLPGRS
jgi:hypothetical protein